MRTIISFDFDGVIHSYKQKYMGADVIPDPPVPGMQTLISELSENHRIFVVSSRAKTPEGAAAIEKYLDEHNFVYEEVTATKVPAVYHIDDRAIHFDGNILNLKYSILRFKQWSKTKGPLSPGDYGKLYYRLSLVPKKVVLDILDKYGHRPRLLNKLGLIEYALNILPPEAFFVIWNKEMRIAPYSDNKAFAKAWNTLGLKKIPTRVSEILARRTKK